MEGRRSGGPVANLLFEAADKAFTLIDVGCSGGIDPRWRLFGDHLTVYAFDPAQHEIARLAAAEANPNVHYINGFVGLPNGHPAKNAVVDPWRIDPWGRLSACRTLVLQRERERAAVSAVTADAMPDPSPPGPSDPAAVEPPEAPTPAVDPADQLDLMRRNLWSEAVLCDPDHPVVLPDFLDAVGVADVDFIKIDVDGVDFEILQSLDKTLADRGVLGMMLEVSYHGGAGEHFNTFHNVDRFMRARGFDLFDLTVRNYSLAALPRPYLFDYPFAAQTTGGRPLQGDALYLRDIGHVHAGRDPAAWSDEKLLKLGALFALFGLHDHAAELLLLSRDRLSPRLDIDRTLNLMVKEAQALDPDLWAGREFASYNDLIIAFEADDPIFYGGLTRRARIGEDLARDRDAANALATKTGSALAQQCEANDKSLRHAAQAELQRDHALRKWQEAEAEMAAMRRSLSWRLTAGLRTVRRRMGSEKARPE